MIRKQSEEKREETITDIFNDLKKENLETMVPDFRKNNISQENVQQVLENLGTKHKSLDKKYILVAVMLLFLKGAATRSTPGTMGIEVNGVTITKQDLENSTNTILGHKFIRRIAEALAVEIGTYAELNSLDGELAGKIDKLIIENNCKTGNNEEPLTTKERAWCSSFSQGARNLKELSSERVVKWLNIDYNERFGKKTGRPNLRK